MPRRKKPVPHSVDTDSVKRELKAFTVETPSWGYAQTGTRFGKFLHPAAATTFEQKVEDAAEVHRLTRITPRLAVHVLWDFPDGFDKSVVKLVRELRDLTRYRKSVIQERTRHANRLHKTLEDAGIKLAAVANDILGVSGRAMLEALVHGTTDPAVLADLARGSLRKKLPALRQV